jgi:hypothetical protein
MHSIAIPVPKGIASPELRAPVRHTAWLWAARAVALARRLRYPASVFLSLVVPADNTRTPRYMEKAFAAIHQANRDRTPITLESERIKSELKGSGVDSAAGWPGRCGFVEARCTGGRAGCHAHAFCVGMCLCLRRSVNRSATAAHGKSRLGPKTCPRKAVGHGTRRARSRIH